MRRPGFFICIEGLDASGKTTQARRLVRNLRRKGFEAVYTTEPSSGEVGKFIREHILQRRKRVPSVVEALLFAADRIDHVERKIKPALQEGKIVVCDRYVFSSMAYQGAAGLNVRWIEEINGSALPPDLAIYLDVPMDLLIKRMKRKRSVMETLEVQRKVQEIYMKLVESGRLVPINGNRPVDEISRNVLEIILDLLKTLKCS